MELYKEEGLQASELSSLQIRMLEANQIPRLLPLDIHEVDARLRLQYRLSSKRMLSHVLKVEALSIQQFAKLLYAIVCTLEESRNYMLYEMNYVLKENFIFIGQDWSDVFLTYVPLDTHRDADDVCPSMDLLLRKLILHVDTKEQTHIQDCIASNSAMKSLQGFKDVLIKLMDKPILREDSDSPHTLLEQDQIDIHPLKAEIHEEPNHSEQIHNIPESSVYSSQSSGLPKPHWKRGESIHIQPRPSIPEMVKENHISFIPISQRARWITVACLLLVNAFLWQRYLTYPEPSSLQLISGISLLLIDVGYVLLKIGLPKLTRPPTDFTSSNHAHISPSSANSSASGATPLDILHYYQNLPMHTTQLTPSNPNATVFLGKPAKHLLTGARLEFQEEGESRTIPIKNGLFTIGRGDTNSKVDCLIEIAGVSRIHAEIVQTSSGYHFRDAGSTNGTFLNDQPIVTYQGYPLKDGDILRIIRQELTFRL
jgi:hypothetical protein